MGRSSCRVPLGNKGHLDLGPLGGLTARERTGGLLPLQLGPEVLFLCFLHVFCCNGN